MATDIDDTSEMNHGFDLSPGQFKSFQELIAESIRKAFEEPQASKIADENGTLVELDPLVNGIPAIETFHHLGHEGKVFIHSKRHTIAAEGTLYILFRVPAGNASRQVHLRYLFTGKENGNDVLNIDVTLYKEPTITGDGTPDNGNMSSTNDAVVKSTGVSIFLNPNVTGDGTFKVTGAILGEKRSVGSKEQSVPEWVFAPDGASVRDYLFKIDNNSSTDTVDLTDALFFYDSEAS